MKLNLVATIVVISFTVQLISRLIVYNTVHGLSHSSEMISSGFYTLVFVIILFSKLVISRHFGIIVAFVFGHFAYFSLCLQILHQSYLVRKFLKKKYPPIKILCNCFNNVIDPIIDVIV